MVSLNQALGTFEKVLNVMGWIPYVRAYSGARRITYGSYEAISGVAFAALKQTGMMSSVDRKKEVNECMRYTLHGAANIFRGTVEVVVPYAMFLCLFYDMMNFRLDYDNEAGAGLRV